MFETLFKALRGASIAASTASSVPTSALLNLSKIVGALPRTSIVETESERIRIPGLKGSTGAIGLPGPPGRTGQDGENTFPGAMGALTTKGGFTPGSVIFAGPSGVLAQDNVHLSYDATTHILTATGFAGPLTGNVTGNADTATKLFTARTIAGISFDGSSNIAIPSTGLSDTTNLARLNAANSFSLVNPLRTIVESWIGPSSTTGIYFKGNNVGFGTSNPIEKFQVTVGTNKYITIGPIAQSGLATDSAVLGFSRATDGAQGVFELSVLGNDFIINARLGYHFYSNATERLTILESGNSGFGLTVPTATIHLKAGTATASTAPFKFTSGVNLTTAEAGAMEYDGADLFFTRAGTVRENVLIAIDNVAAPSTSVGVIIANYYGSSATNFLGTPNRWLSVNVLGATYKIPLYS